MKSDAGSLVRDFLVFQLKLALDGLKDFIAINLSILAVIVDLLLGSRGDGRLFYRVVRFSASFERWLRLHRVKGAEIEPGVGSLRAPDADAVIDELERAARRRTGGK